MTPPPPAVPSASDPIADALVIETARVVTEQEGAQRGAARVDLLTGEGLVARGTTGAGSLARGTRGGT